MGNFKAHVRKLTWLYRANARLKCWQIKRRCRATLKSYAAGMTLRNSEAPLVTMNQAEWHEAHRRPRVFFMGQMGNRTAVLLRPYKHIADVEVLAREDGAWGQNDPAVTLSVLMLCIHFLPV
jgi:hypothetical protein